MHGVRKNNLNLDVVAKLPFNLIADSVPKSTQLRLSHIDCLFDHRLLLT